jgi:hypothetical protein
VSEQGGDDERGKEPELAVRHDVAEKVRIHDTHDSPPPMTLPQRSSARLLIIDPDRRLFRYEDGREQPFWATSTRMPRRPSDGIRDE